MLSSEFPRDTDHQGLRGKSALPDCWLPDPLTPAKKERFQANQPVLSPLFLSHPLHQRKTSYSFLDSFRVMLTSSTRSRECRYVFPVLLVYS